MTDCEHPKTVEIFKGIFKCSSCGDRWDEATPEQKAEREAGLERGEQFRKRKAQRVEHYKRRARYGG